MKDSANKKIIIIGGGISGLTTGIYAQKNGYISEIYERNSAPGGLCFAWERKGYKIDGCIHWMTGTHSGNELNDMWKYVDAFDDDDIIMDDNFGTIEVDGTKIVLWNDVDKLQEELLEISPKDKRIIKKWMRLLKHIFNVPLPMQNAISTMNVWHLICLGIHMLPHLPAIIYCLTTSNEKFAKKFKSPVLQKVIREVVPGEKANLYQMVYAYGTCVNNNGGVPRGGSMGLVNRLVYNYEKLGGLIHTNSDVDEIVIENKKAVGIKLKNGETAYADYVVSSADVHVTTQQLLKGKYTTHRFTNRDNKQYKYHAPSCVLLSYSVSVDKLKELGITTTYEFDTDPYVVGGETRSTIRIRTYAYDNTFIKNGRVLLGVLVHQDDENYEYWVNLRQNYKKYLEHKTYLGTLIKNKIEEHFPSLKDDVELLDVATPVTFNRYTNAYHGAYMSWELTHNNSMLIHDGKIRGIKNLVLAGQWIQMPGGLPIALVTGKYAIDRINKKEGKYQFVKPVKRANIH